MVMESIWVFSISLSVGITPLALLLYNSPFSLWREHIPPHLCILLEPIFVCSYRETYTELQQQQNSPRTRRQEGSRKSLLLPLTHAHTHTHAIVHAHAKTHHSYYFSNFSFYSFQNDTFTVPVRKSLLRNAGGKEINAKKRKRNCQGQTKFLPVSICSPLRPYPSSSLPHPPSISFSLSFSLWWRIVIPLGSIFQASEHPFTAAITNL